MKIYEKVIGKIALPVLAMAAALLIFVAVLSTQNTNKENNGYIRVINCVISIPAKVRTQADIEKCYKSVEKDLDIQLQRYDTSSYRD